MYTNPINILVVDDEPCICSSIREFLGVHEDLNVDTVNSTVDARTALGHQRYDAIICDYQMPDEDGISFLRWLRSRGDSIPFLLFTEKGREEVTITALNCGADSYLQKGSRISSLCAEMDKRIRTLVERDRELRKMKDRARMFQTLMNQTKEAMYLHELSGKIIEVNETAVRDSGYTRDELLGMSVFKIDPTLENLPDRDANWKRLCSTKYRTFNAFHRRKDGNLYPTEVRISKIQINDLDYILSLAEDVSIRRYTEGELKKALDKFFSCIYSSNKGMFICDEEGRCHEANETVCAITACSRSDLLLRSVFDMLISEERDLVSRHLRIARHEGKTHVNLSMIGGDGVVRRYAIDLVRMTTERYLGFIEQLPEVSKRKDRYDSGAP